MPGLYDDDEDYGQEQSGPKALRDQLDKLKKELAEKDKALEAERKTNADLAKQVKSTTLRDKLADAGIDPKYASRAERDGVEPTEESVKQWIDENKDVYVFLNKPAAQTDDPAGDVADAGDEGEADELDQDFVNQVLAAQAVETSGRPSGSTTIDNLLAGVDPSKFKDEAEIDAFIKSLKPPSPYGS